MTLLSDATLGRLGKHVQTPSYDRSQLTHGIVHFGIGGFHRAHEAMYVDRLLEQGSVESDWAIVGVGVLDHDDRIVNTLNDQDGLYTLVLKHPDGSREARVIGSILRALHAPADPQAVIDLLADPATRVVSLTITEGGYLINPSTGEFDPREKAVREELTAGADGGLPRTVFGYILAGLRARRAAGVEPFTVMSCDNIPGNGHVAHMVVQAAARMSDPELAQWIGSTMSFPNSMVDRITPETTAEDIDRLAEEGVQDGWPVVCEPFIQWALEDGFGALGRPPWEEAGVQVVQDVVPFELMKLRLLNASHQALCYLGYLHGYRYAHEVGQDPDFVAFLRGYMTDEGIPSLPSVPDTDLHDYVDTLLERFANPEVRDTLARLCAESSDRIPKWLLPVIQHNLAHDGPVEHSALVVAAWARYAEGHDEQGEPIEVVDGLREQVMAAAAGQAQEPMAFLRQPDLFGDLVEHERFTTAYSHALASLHKDGAQQTVRALLGGNGSGTLSR